MDRVRDNEGCFTDEALALESEFRCAVKDIIHDQVVLGTPTEVIHYIACTAIRDELLESNSNV